MSPFAPIETARLRLQVAPPSGAAGLLDFFKSNAEHLAPSSPPRPEHFLTRLHRIMANYLPVNERSGRLLKRLGFVVEGYARDYLYIDGAWRDHILTALTDPRSQRPTF